ncbi:ATP-binding protein [bacterium]|nr:ATP-binding protein [bacterium]
MTPEKLEPLLFEDEGTALDFKRDQYPFAKATEEEKSELLKDILGFVNCWRRTEAFIVIGVEEVQGAKGIVHGVAGHLQDHSLQQFVNNLTNRPVQFGYETCELEGKQIGIIRIEQQQRPIYLKRDYGKLKKEKVYIRRGSSTDPGKPAGIDEIASMGAAAQEAECAKLNIEFASTSSEAMLGPQIQWEAELCRMPEDDKIPFLKERSNNVKLPDGTSIGLPNLASFSMDNRLNERFFKELAYYEFHHRLYQEVRLVVENTGAVVASDVRIEAALKKGTGIVVIRKSKMPDRPKRRESVLGNMGVMKDIVLHQGLRDPGCVIIDTDDEQMKIEIDCGNIQPGRKVWSDVFCIGVGQTGEYEVNGQMFAGNLAERQTFTLKIDATITENEVSIKDLYAME